MPLRHKTQLLVVLVGLLAPFDCARGSTLGIGGLYGIGSKIWRRQVVQKGTVYTSTEEGPKSTHFFTQAKVDHFGATPDTEAVWKQRFHVDTTHWGGSGKPIFLYIGGEGTAGPPSDGMFMGELAKEHSAMMVVLEHRYYGESYPVRDMSTRRLRYLSSQQALADLMWFITWFKSDPSTSSEPPLELPGTTKESLWVAFGGSYPGNLAAWLKLKYPHLLAGSVASSAPVQAEYNFEQYAQVVGTALQSPLVGGSNSCFSNTKDAVESLRSLVVATAPYGQHQDIPEALRPCGPMLDDLDLTAYEAELFGNFQGTVQYNEETAGPSVAQLCQIMTNSSADLSPLEAFATVAQMFHDMSETQCVSSSFQNDIVKPLVNETFSGAGCAARGDCNMVRQWIYQSCREFGFFQTTTGDGHPFAAFSSLTVQNAGASICKAAYGISNHPWVDWSNSMYGGREVEGINITLVNGSLDPWHSLGIINTTSPFYESCTDTCTRQVLSRSEDTVFLAGTAHCRDMYASRPDDPESVQWAHAKIRRDVSRYLGVTTQQFPDQSFVTIVTA